MPQNGNVTLENVQPAQNTPVDVIFSSFGPGIPSQTGKQILTIQASTAWQIWDLCFLLTGISLAMIQEFRVLVNNAIIVRVAGTDWNAMNVLDQVPTYAGAGSNVPLSWFFKRLNISGGAQAISPSTGKGLPVLLSGSSKDQALWTTLNCGVSDANGYGIASLNFEFDLVDTSSTVPGIQVHAHASSPDSGGAGWVRRMEYQTPNMSSGSNFEMNKNALSFGDTKHQFLNRVHMVPAVEETATTLDNFVFRYNGIQIRSRSSAENDYIINTMNIHVSQSTNGMYSLMFDENTFGDEVLPIGNSSTDLQVTLTPTVSGGGTTQVRVYQDSWGLL